MRKKLLLFLFLAIRLSAHSQDSTTYRIFPITISAFNNQTTLPVGMKLGIAESPVHPGISIGTSYLWQEKTRHLLQQTGTLGYYYHQYSQHGIQLYTELQYRYTRLKWLRPEAGAGLGYLHAISDLEQFKLNSNGEYEKKKNFGRPQAMVSTHIGLFIPLKKNSTDAGCTMCRNSATHRVQNGFFVRYQFWLQAPFVKNYVPMLPNTALHIGYCTSLQVKRKTGGKK